MDEVRHHIVLLFLFGQEAIVVLPVILIHASVEGTRCNSALFALSFLPFILLMLKEHGILIRQPFIVTEEPATCQRSDLRLRLFP